MDIGLCDVYALYAVDAKRQISRTIANQNTVAACDSVNVAPAVRFMDQYSVWCNALPKSELLPYTTILHMRRSAFLLLLILLFCEEAFAQGTSSAGREYWLGFMPNKILSATNFRLHLCSSTKNRVYIEIYGASGVPEIAKSYTMAADQAITVSLNASSAETIDAEKPTYRAVRITSDSDLFVSAYSDNSLSAASFLVLPITLLGKSYYCVTFPNDPTQTEATKIGGEFLIVAPYDNTKVTITATANTNTSANPAVISRYAGSTWTVNLQRGQTYLVQSTGIGDLTGSHIASDKPVASISGHRFARVDIAETSSGRDHMAEMLLPTDLWGTEYYHVETRSMGNYLRIISAEDGNTITSLYQSFNLDAGEFADIPRSHDADYIRSTNGRKFMVVEIGHSTGYLGDQTPDDVYMLALPSAQTMSKTMIFRTPSNLGGGSFTHRAVFITEQSNLGEIRLKQGNNVPRPLSALGATITAIPTTNKYSASVRLTGDEVTLIASAPEPFQLALYSSASNESAAHVAGMRLTSLTDTISPMLDMETGGTCQGSVTVARDASGIVSIAATGDWVLTDSLPFIVGDTVVRLYVINPKPGHSAFGSIEATDRFGNTSRLMLDYWGEDIRVLDTVTLDARLGDTVCATLRIANLGEQDWEDVSLALSDHNQGLSVRDPDRSFPFGVMDTLRVTICYTPTDSARISDTLRMLGKMCSTVEAPLRLAARVPLLYANNLAIRHTTGVGCDSLLLENRSDTYVLITSATNAHPEFYLEDTSIFPLRLEAGERRSISVCHLGNFVGLFRDTIKWETDLGLPQIKSFSVVDALVSQKQSVQHLSTGTVRVWPNPSDEYFQLELPVVPASIVGEIVDVRGVVVGPPLSLSRSLNQQISVLTLSPGAYRLVLHVDGERVIVPFVKD